MTERYESLMDQAMEASAAGDVQQAVRWLDAAAEAAPHMPAPHLLKGAELAQAGDVLGAEQAYANALLVSPELQIARFQLGLLQLTSQRVALALVTWQPLWVLPEQDPMRHYVRGFEALVRDESRAAMQHFSEGLACENLNPALVTDIRMVMRSIEAQTEPAQAASVDDGSDTDVNHVLLSNYR